MQTITALDWVLAPGILILSAVLLNIRDLFAAVVLFIVFGLLMAMTWVRLDAVDIALAEAAIGAGITGALLLHAFGDMAARRGDDPEQAAWLAKVPGTQWLLPAILVTPIALLLGYAVVSAPADLDLLRPRVDAALAETGTEHDITAVLLSFRAYDTLLELSILLLAVVGAWSLRLSFAPRGPTRAGLLLQSTTRLLVPIAVLIAGYLIWRGSHAPGGAFQGGAVLAGSAVLLLLGLRSAWPSGLEPAVNIGLSIGIVALTLAGLIPTLINQPFLFYRGPWAEVLMILIELAASLSIALALVGIYIGRAHWEPLEDE